MPSNSNECKVTIGSRTTHVPCDSSYTFSAAQNQIKAEASGTISSAFLKLIEQKKKSQK